LIEVAALRQEYHALEAEIQSLKIGGGIIGGGGGGEGSGVERARVELIPSAARARPRAEKEYAGGLSNV
jgi:hypothetical protein